MNAPHIDIHIRDRARLLDIVCIGGSLRPGSFCYRTLDHVVELFALEGVPARIVDLRHMTLPFCNGDKTDPCPAFPDVQRLRDAVTRAHGLVLATPEYHGGVSGVLKNVLDLLDFPHLEGKVIAGVSVLGGVDNSNALNDLRRITRWCHTWMIPEQVAIGKVRQVYANGLIEDEELLERLEALVRSMVVNTLRLNGPVGEAPMPVAEMDDVPTERPSPWTIHSGQRGWKARRNQDS